MKKIIIGLVFGMILVSSCDDDFLNREPIDQLASSAIFSDQALADAYLNNIIGRLPAGQYNSPGGGYGNNYLLASISDEARSKSGWIPSNTTVRVGQINPTNLAALNIWGEAYAAIRQVNEFLLGVQDTDFDAEFIESGSAKARFVRAWFYFDLVRRYGDVPLLKEPQSFDDEIFPSRTPTTEVYQFIFDEFNDILTALPNKSEAKAGALTRQAAIGLNARAMLYAERYADAAALANRLISGADNDGLELYGANPVDGATANQNYGDLFLSEGDNVETVYEITFAPPERSHQFDRGNWPVRWRNDNGGQTDPTQELIDDFEMANGLPIEDAASGYNPADPYANRDPRFYAAVFYHGAEFSQVLPSRGEPFIDMEWNAFNEGPGPIRDGNASVTGYLVRKWADASLGFAPEGVSKVAWQEVRFAEVLLIYAEAENELNGPSADVEAAVNRVRTRAGLPNLPGGLSQAGMREKIRQERRIELVFENHRWFDLIRWDLAKTVLNDTFHGMRIDRNGVPTAADGGPTHVFDPAQLTFTYFDTPAFTNEFPDKYMLLPIPQNEIEANENLRPQNPGY
jgi:hypothetical protein